MSEYVTCNGGCDNSDYDDKRNKTCNATGFQKINVCVPVTVTPFAKAGKTKTKCCGDAVVTCGNNNCPGRKRLLHIHNQPKNLC